MNDETKIREYIATLSAVNIAKMEDLKTYRPAAEIGSVIDEATGYQRALFDLSHLLSSKKNKRCASIANLADSL